MELRPIPEVEVHAAALQFVHAPLNTAFQCDRIIHALQIRGEQRHVGELQTRTVQARIHEDVCIERVEVSQFL